MKISVATYSLTRLIRTGDMTLLGVVDWLAEQGIQGIEINGLEGYTKGSVAPLARSLSARIAKRGLTPTSYTVGANLLLREDDPSDDPTAEYPDPPADAESEEVAQAAEDADPVDGDASPDEGDQ